MIAQGYYKYYDMADYGAQNFNLSFMLVIFVMFFLHVSIFIHLYLIECL